MINLENPSGGGNQNLLPPFKKRRGGGGSNYENSTISDFINNAFVWYRFEPINHYLDNKPLVTLYLIG